MCRACLSLIIEGMIQSSVPIDAQVYDCAMPYFPEMSPVKSEEVGFLMSPFPITYSHLTSLYCIVLLLISNLWDTMSFYYGFYDRGVSRPFYLLVGIHANRGLISEVTWHITKFLIFSSPMSMGHQGEGVWHKKILDANTLYKLILLCLTSVVKTCSFLSCLKIKKIK